MSPSQPESAAIFARATASEVDSAEIAPTTDPRPPTLRTQARKISCFSENDRVAPSPNEPRATTPLQPLSRSQRQCSAMNPRSRLRSVRKHVVIAGITPFHFISLLLLLLVVPQSQNGSLRDCPPSPEKSAAGPNPAPSRKEPRLPVRISVLGTVP